MRFCVSQEVFDAFPSACFGVVVAKGLEAAKVCTASELLAASVQSVPEKFGTEGVKAHPHIVIWRDAFLKMGLNPNKFQSSVEALSSRVHKSGQLPSINPVVDLVNALSLKYILPMGAHDIELMKGDIHLRVSRPGDRFTPFGAAETEEVPEGEIVYADEEEIRTRRWVWRQGDKAKIRPESGYIFFPIDGFADKNLGQILDARDELAGILSGAAQSVIVGFIDRRRMIMEWD